MLDLDEQIPIIHQLLKSINHHRKSSFILTLISSILLSSFRSFKMRHNQSFLNRVSFRRRPPPPPSTPIVNNPNTPSISTPIVTNNKRSCMDTLSETASLTPSESINLHHDGSSSGRILWFFLQLNLKICFVLKRMKMISCIM